MTEPNYEYVKGQGWVVSSSTIVFMKCGTRVRLEFRDPERGEHHMCCNKKVLDPLKLFLERCSYQYYEDRIVCREGSASGIYTYCVLVPV